MRRLCLTTVAILLAVTTASLALGSGEELAIPWHTIAGGGTTASCGGGYCLSGSIGQPAARSSSDVAYALQGGFWVVAATPDGGGHLIYLPLVCR